jgi:uncharacterized protein YodC (DUF2158 family)
MSACCDWQTTVGGQSKTLPGSRRRAIGSHPRYGKTLGAPEKYALELWHRVNQARSSWRAKSNHGLIHSWSTIHFSKEVSMSQVQNRFKTGSAVVLASGGPSMTVERYVQTSVGPRVRCVWSVAGVAQRDDFVEETLIEDQPDFEIVSVGFPSHIK